MDIALGISDPRQQIGQISDEFGVTADDDGSGLAKDQHDWAPKSWFKGKSREETRGKTPPIIGVFHKFSLKPTPVLKWAKKGLPRLRLRVFQLHTGGMINSSVLILLHHHRHWLPPPPDPLSQRLAD